MSGDGRVRMPADVDAPDKIVYGLTWRQLAILAIAAFGGYGGWRALHTIVAVPVLAGAAVIVGGLALMLAVGRRDGLPMDRWLLAAVRLSRAPRALSATDATAVLPDWIQQPPSRMKLPAPLRLPVDAITDDGEITLGGARAAMIASTTVNLALRTAEERAALIDTFGRWLNSLSTPTQIVVSAQPVDLQSHARALADTAVGMPHPALADAANDHARFLADLAERRDPLRRQVLIITRAAVGERGEHAARRRADGAVRALSGLGVTARALDGHAATAALAAAADPYRPPRHGGLATGDTIITGTALAVPRRRS